MQPGTIGRKLMVMAVTGAAAGMADRRRGGPSIAAATAALRRQAVGRDPGLRRALVVYLAVLLVVLAAFTVAGIVLL